MGFRVTVLEGRDRIGGRIWTDDSLGVPIDLGASWIHGPGGGNPITSLAADFGAETAYTDFDALYLYDVDGTQVTDAELEEVVAVAEEVVYDLARIQRATSDDETTIASAVDQLLRERTMSEKLRRGVAWALVSLIAQDQAADLSELSLRTWDDDESFSEGDVLFPQGYRQITDGLAQGLDVRLGQIVSAVAYDQQGVRVTTNQGEFQGDRAVVTLPLGVLKKGDIMFSPSLPEDKRAVIQRLGVGALNKIVLRFSDPFWPKKPHYLSCMEDDAEKTMGFLNMTPQTGYPILVVFSHGAHARSLEPLPPDDAVAQPMALLGKMLGASIPDPDDFVITRWSSDDFAWGSYSHVAPGSNRADMDVLARPVAGRLFFAGEATIAEYSATVHGAFLSGEREADRIRKLVD